MLYTHTVRKLGLLAFLTLLFRVSVGGVALGQALQPATITVTRPAVPEVVQVLDTSGAWTEMGWMDPTNHIFNKGPPGTIVVTDPAVGMTPVVGSVWTDNSAFIATLNTAIGPTGSGYEVIIPGIPGKLNTIYYFSQPWLQIRNAKYRCVAPVGGSVILDFAAGVDGVIQQAGEFDGCQLQNFGAGLAYANPLSNTLIDVSMYYTGASVSPVWHAHDGIIASGRSPFYPTQSFPPIAPGTTVTTVNGDGSLVLSALPNQFFGGSAAGWSTTPLRSTAVFTGNGNNFVNNDAINVAGVIYHAVTILNTASHNFLIGPDFQTSAMNLVSAVMNTTGQYLTYVPDTNSAGSRYLLSNGLVTAAFDGVSNITFTSRFGGPGVNTFVSTYTPAGTSAGSFGGATFTGAEDSSSCALPCSQLNSEIFLWQLPAADAFQVSASIGQYVMAWKQPALPAVQLFNGDKIWSGVFPWGSTVSQLRSGSIFQQMSTNNFGNLDTIQAGNNTFTAETMLDSTPGAFLIGPNFAVSSANLAEAVANSPAVDRGVKFNAPTNVSNVSLAGAVNPTWLTFYSTTFQSPTTNAYLSVYTPASTPAGTMLAANFGTYTAVPVWQPGAGNQLAIATAAPGSEVPLWIMPTADKRRSVSIAKDNVFRTWPIGASMICSAGFGNNCDLSRDENNYHMLDFVGRWAEGDNYATSSTKDEQFSSNYAADDLELGTIGESLYNPNYESTESSTSNYGILMFCGSQNATGIFGGYIGGGNMCSSPTTIIPGLPFGGPASIALNSGQTSGQNNGLGSCCGPVLYKSAINGTSGIFVTIGGFPAPNEPALVWDTQVASSPTINELAYNILNQEWVNLTGSGAPAYRMVFPTSLSNDYGGSVNNLGVNFPLGVVLGNNESGALSNTHAIALSASSTKPTGTFHHQMDCAWNTLSGQGGAAFWCDVYGSSAFVAEASGTALTIMQTTNATAQPAPPPTIPRISNGGSGYASGTNLTGTMTGTFSGCTTEPVINVTASGATGAILTVNSYVTLPVCVAVPSSAPWTPGGALLAGTGASFLLTWAPDVTAGQIVIGQTLGSPYPAGTTIISGSGAAWVTSGSATISSPTSVTGSSWRAAALIAQDPAGTTYQVGAATTIANLPACTSSNVGDATISNGIASPTYMQAVSATGTSTRKINCDGTSWAYH
jgi:hypothetical protein